MVMPYLSFEGNCEEAFQWYERVFEGRIEHMSKYGDMPDQPGMPLGDEQKRRVMHAQMMLTPNGGISGADVFQPLEKGNTVSIHIHLENEAKAIDIFNKLSEGGTVIGPIGTNPPPDDHGVSGCVKDRYGFTWILSAMKG